MSSQVFSIDPTPSEHEQKRVVEAEIKLGMPKDWHLPHLDAEPIRHAAGQVLLTTLGLGVLAVRGARRALQAAYSAGNQAAEKEGSLAHAIRNLAEAKPAPAVQVTKSTQVPMLPVSDYDALSLAELEARLAKLDSGALRVVREYELDHARRTTVLEAIARYLEGA